MNAISAATDKDKCAKFIHNMQNGKGSQMASLTQFWKKCQLRRLVMKATIYMYLHVLASYYSLYCEPIWLTT